jgi:hypothetical protein
MLQTNQMSYFYVKQQCRHCKHETTLATIKDSLEAAELIQAWANQREYGDFTYVVETPKKFELKDSTDSETQ